MTLEVSCSTADLKVTALIITNNVDTHSAIQEVEKITVDNILYRIQKQLELLLQEAYAKRKRT